MDKTLVTRDKISILSYPSCSAVLCNLRRTQLPTGKGSQGSTHTPEIQGVRLCKFECYVLYLFKGNKFYLNVGEIPPNEVLFAHGN